MMFMLIMADFDADDNGRLMLIMADAAWLMLLLLLMRCMHHVTYLLQAAV